MLLGAGVPKIPVELANSQNSQLPKTCDIFSSRYSTEVFIMLLLLRFGEFDIRVLSSILISVRIFVYDI